MTSLSLYKTYIQPVFTYGLEIVQPKQSNLVKLELFQKSILKQTLSLPINTPGKIFLILMNQLLLSVDLLSSCLIASCFSIALSGCLHILLNRVMHLMSIIASTGSSPDRI
jgi:hypothetical protein